MKRTTFPIVFATVLSLSTLAACGEKAQTGLGVKGVQPAYKSVDSTSAPFVTPGWKAGDKTSWELALKARAQNTQNEYNKMVVSK